MKSSALKEGSRLTKLCFLWRRLVFGSITVLQHLRIDRPLGHLVDDSNDVVWCSLGKLLERRKVAGYGNQRRFQNHARRALLESGKEIVIDAGFVPVGDDLRADRANLGSIARTQL